MSGGLRIATQDPDLGLTVALWLADLLRAFAGANPAAGVVISDAGYVGRPFRKGVLRRRPDFRASREGDVVTLECSSSSVVFADRPNAATVRKAMVRLGLTHDAVPIDHLQVVRQQQRIRTAAAAALGVSTGDAPCRFLLRIDDYPSLFASLDDFREFHRIAAQHRIPYLLAVTPFFGLEGSDRPLSTAEIDLLRSCAADGVDLALHGFSHRSRYRNYASELAGLPAAALRHELDRAGEFLGDYGLAPLGFVAPYNGYDPLTVGAIAERYPLICGGPESALTLGYRAGPSFLLNSLYVPSYRDAYDVTSSKSARFSRVVAESNGLTVPITLHWANEVRDGFRAFRTLCERLHGRTLRWSAFIADAAASTAWGRRA